MEQEIPMRYIDGLRFNKALKTKEIITHTNGHLYNVFFSSNSGWPKGIFTIDTVKKNTGLEKYDNQNIRAHKTFIEWTSKFVTLMQKMPAIF